MRTNLIAIVVVLFSIFAFRPVEARSPWLTRLLKPPKPPKMEVRARGWSGQVIPKPATKRMPTQEDTLSLHRKLDELLNTEILLYETKAALTATSPTTQRQLYQRLIVRNEWLTLNRKRLEKAIEKTLELIDLKGQARDYILRKLKEIEDHQ